MEVEDSSSEQMEDRSPEEARSPEVEQRSLVGEQSPGEESESLQELTEHGGFPSFVQGQSCLHWLHCQELLQLWKSC